MSSLRLVLASAPVSELPPLIARLGLHDQFLLEESEGFRMDVVGRTIAQARGDPGLARLARDRYGLGVLIDPDSWRNQWPLEDRPVNFQKARFASRQPLDFARRPLSAAEEDAYVRATLEEEVAARASVFVAPYHLGGGPDCPTRRLDLRLARRTVSRARALRLNEPRGTDSFPRAGQVLVCVCIRTAELLDPATRQMLAHLYAQIDADGYLLKVAGLSEHTPVGQAGAVANFAFTLKLLTNRPVVLAGGKNLAYAFVGAGLDAAMLGIGDGEVFSPGASAHGGGARPVYHAGILRSVYTHGTNVAAAFRAEILFARHPCGCGHHRRDQPPRGHRERKLHTLSERLHDFNTAASWGESEAQSRLTERVAAANRLAVLRGYPPLPDSFVVVAEQAELTRRRARRAEERG